ncbi:MAG TPA: hypothetical protein VGQ83_36490 [Polyangia bacterium]|jgi:predicted esterase
MRSRLPAWVVLAVLAGGCGGRDGAAPRSDGGAAGPEAGTPDEPGTGAPLGDGAGGDDGPRGPDAAALDAPLGPDAAAADAALGPDAPTPDAPLGADAPAPDAPLGPDAAVADAAAADAGLLDGGPADGPLDAGELTDAAAPADGPLDAAPASTRHTARPLGSTTAPNGFYEYLPPGYPDGQLWPLLVFWHGKDENGDGTTDLAKVLANGPPQLISADQWPATRPFLVLSPQHTTPDSGVLCPPAAEIRAFITWAAANYPVDPRQVYLTGLSCGAIASWAYLGAYRGEAVAAAVLIAGNPGDPALASSAWGRAGCSLGEVAIWSFHGDADTRVPIANDQATMALLLACPAPPRREARWTIVPDGGHPIWGPIYDLDAGAPIYDFLLQNPGP